MTLTNPTDLEKILLDIEFNIDEKVKNILWPTGTTGTVVGIVREDNETKYLVKHNNVTSIVSNLWLYSK